MTEVQYLTQEKYDQLQTELKKLKTKTMPETAGRIDEARQMGDLKENAEYHAAREELAWQQARVKEIEFLLDNAEIVKKSTAGGAVDIGNTIVVEVNGKEREYTLVGAQEADPLEGKISNESPLGEAFIGKKKGDEVTVEIPAGEQVYKILEVK